MASRLRDFREAVCRQTRLPGRMASSSLGLLRDFLGKKGFSIGLALGIDVDQNLGPGELLLEILFDAIEAIMGLLHGPARGHPHVELNEAKSSTLASTKIVKSAELVVLGRRKEKLLALFLWPLAVHELVHCFARCPPTAPQQPKTNADTDDGVGAFKSKRLFKDKGDRNRHVKEEIGLIVDVVRFDCHRTRAIDHLSLVPEQTEGEDDCEQGDGDTIAHSLRSSAVYQTLNGPPADPDGGNGDQYDLSKCNERLRLAVTEPVVVVSGHCGNADAK